MKSLSKWRNFHFECVWWLYHHYNYVTCASHCLPPPATCLFVQQLVTLIPNKTLAIWIIGPVLWLNIRAAPVVSSHKRQVMRKTFPNDVMLRDTSSHGHSDVIMVVADGLVPSLYEEIRNVQGPVSISDKTSYFEISWSLEAARWVFNEIARSL